MVPQAYAINDPQKSLTYRVRRASGLVNMSTYKQGDVPQLHRDSSPCAQDLSKPHFVYFFIWPFTVVFVIFFIIKPVNVNKRFPESEEPSYEQTAEPEEGVVEL